MITDSCISLFFSIFDASPTLLLCESEHQSCIISHDKLRHVYVTTDGKVTNQLVPSTIELSLKRNESISFSHHVLLSFYLRYVCRILVSRIPPSTSRYACHGRTHNFRSLSLMRYGPMHLDQVDVPSFIKSTVQKLGVALLASCCLTLHCVRFRINRSSFTWKYSELLEVSNG